jgi:hypothetical protein
MTKIVEPPILYLGTPVVLVSTLNLDGSAGCPNCFVPGAVCS